MMSSRVFFALRMVAEAAQVARRRNRRRQLALRRNMLSVSDITDTHFIQRYRLNKSAYYHLCNILSELTDLRSSQRVSLETKVLCALLFYANGDYQRVIGLANCFSQEAISRYVNEVTRALNHPNVVRRYISFPSTSEAREQVKQRYYDKYGIPGVLGSIDGSHFPIFTPPKNMEHHFYCRKHYHSINVQMVCDHDTRILNVNPKFGGAAHDAFVWENSDLNDYMQMLHRNGECCWLLGDSGYPQRPWLMTPYNNPTPGTSQETYNKIHSKTRVIIENTFGRMKNRWRCLCKQRVLHYKPKKCAQIITACAVLHNLTLDFNVPAPRDIVVDPEFHRLEVPEQGQGEPSFLILGRATRDTLAQRLHGARDL